MEEKKKTQEVNPVKMFTYGVVSILVVGLLITAGVGIKETKKVSQSGFALSVAKVLNLPAAKVNGMKVLYTEYIEDVKTLNNFYEKTPEVPSPGEDEISNQVISRLVANKLIAKNAKEYNVEIDDEGLEEFKQTLLSQFPDEETAETELMDKYGWNLDKYMKKVGEPILLEQKLQEAFANEEAENLDEKYLTEEISARHILFLTSEDENNEVVKERAQGVLQRIKDGEDFATLAAEYGSDGTKDTGGDLGWFGRSEMVPEFENAVFALEAGELGQELVQTAYGFHIVQVMEKRQTGDYFAFMDDQFKNADIKILIDIPNPFADLLAEEEVIEVDEPIVIETEEDSIEEVVE